MIRFKHLLAIVLIYFGATKSSYAQITNTSAPQVSQGHLDDLTRTINRNRDNSVYIKGSPYINETFKDVKLKRFGNKTFSGRYDAYLGEMQIKIENDTIALNSSENFELTFPLNNKVYKTSIYTNKEGVSKRGFLVVLAETDSMAFLKEEVIILYDKIIATTGYDRDKPAEYKRAKDIYYYRLGDNISLLPQSRKNFLQLFPEHATELKTFIKKNKISLKEDKDLITLFQFLETIKP